MAVAVAGGATAAVGATAAAAAAAAVVADSAQGTPTLLLLRQCRPQRPYRRRRRGFGLTQAIGGRAVAAVATAPALLLRHNNRKANAKRSLWS
jgi:hypothetical protein